MRIENDCLRRLERDAVVLEQGHISPVSLREGAIKDVVVVEAADSLHLLEKRDLQDGRRERLTEHPT
jgi:hypothetical protein